MQAPVWRFHSSTVSSSLALVSRSRRFTVISHTRINRVEITFKEITSQMKLAMHGAYAFEGLLARTVAFLAPHTLLLTQLREAT
jgi:hypothetical protein